MWSWQRAFSVFSANMSLALDTNSKVKKNHCTMFSRFHNNVLCNACKIQYYYQFWILHSKQTPLTFSSENVCCTCCCLYCQIDQCCWRLHYLLVFWFIALPSVHCRTRWAVVQCESFLVLCCEILFLNVTLSSTFVLFNALSNCNNLLCL